MNKRKILAVYNTCGIGGDNTGWYIESINTLLNQDLGGVRVMLSSCKNSPECIKEIYSVFREKISYFLTPEVYTVNITFNKAVQEVVRRTGEFDGYMYIDSGCTMDDQQDIFSLTYKTMLKDNNGIIIVQTDTDECLENLGPSYLYQSPEIQIKDSDLVVPIGVSVNQHVALFSNEIYKRYGKLYPDVFAAFCSESVLNYIAASVRLRWVIMADKQVRHLKAVDGPSSGFTHRVEAKDKDGKMIKDNFWNNLLYNRDVLEFLNNKEAYESGLGYEECNKIMPHNPEAYNKEGFCKDPARLSKVIEEYLYLSDKELNYNKIKCKFIA
jgi:hypothetical protein